MTGWRKRQVMEMAREADLIDDTSASDWYVYQLERFAELVRADERDKFLAALRQLHDSYSLASDPNGLKERGQKRPQNCGTGYCSCIECLFEQSEQELVKWSDYEPDGMHHNKPAQRTCVSLTDEQWQVIADTLDCVITRSQKNVIEAKLKEKNFD